MSQDAFSKSLTFQSPVKRDGTDDISSVKLRRPKSGDLRGQSLAKIQMQDVDVMITVISRLSSPSLATSEVADLDIADLTDLSLKVVGFLFTQEQINMATT